MAAFNSDEFGWNEITVSINGRVMMACTSIEYTDEVESELIYGKGGEPLGVKDGNRKYSGNLKCLQSEFDKIVPDGDKGVKSLKNLSIQWAYEMDGKISTRVFTGCRITKIGEASKQNDKTVEVEFPFIFTSINIY